MSAGLDDVPISTENCVLHPFEVSDRVCHHCGRWHCDGCLVAPWGPRKAVLCVDCAINRSGVRRSAGGTPTRTAREIRELEKGTRRQQREDSRRTVVVTPNGLSRSEAPPKPAKRSLLQRIRPA